MPFSLGIKDVIDIVSVALLLFYIYRLMRDSGSLNIFYGILIFFGAWVLVSQIFQLRLLGTLFDKLISVGALALIILFQEEIRRFFITLGTHRHFNSLMRLFFGKRKKKDSGNSVVMPIVLACMNMSKSKIGALIVIERDMSLNDIANSGEKIDAVISQRLIENIFFKNSPLHDGAMIISHNRIVAAGCLLPVSHDLSVPKELGLRHRAALGMTQQSDALSIIVSEETGDISVAQHGQFDLRLTSDELEGYIVKATTSMEDEKK